MAAACYWLWPKRRGISGEPRQRSGKLRQHILLSRERPDANMVEDISARAAIRNARASCSASPAASATQR